MKFFNWISTTFFRRLHLRSLTTWLLVCTLIYVSRKRLTRKRDDEEDLDELPGPSSRLSREQTLPTELKSSPTRLTGTHAIPKDREDAEILEGDAGYEHDLRLQTTTFDAGTATASPCLDEESIHGQLNRTERLFLDRINTCDEEELIAACHRMNSEITTCTQVIAEEWSQAIPEDLEQVEVSESSVPSVMPGSAGDAIGSELSRRIQVSKSPHSNLDLESTLEFGLRALTIDCVRTYISSFLLTASESDLEDIANELAASDRSTANAWTALLQEAWQSPLAGQQKNSTSLLEETFQRLTKIYGARGQLSMALRWKALAYQVITKDKKNPSNALRSRMLEGMRQILQSACTTSDPSHPPSGDFPTDEHIACLFEPMNHLANIIHTGFMTGIYNISVVRPGTTYDDHQMEAWDAEELQPGTAQPVVCTIELGVCKTSTQHAVDAQHSNGNLYMVKEQVLLKPIVLV
ncbi:hypothetical protein SCHPADRAFT_940953 [Schizopora paradoxa]|uniref:Uncharacterized protein n=1 Tax=Schizopora paradoxa TaxID=27342 RepID=A0A0H2RLK7_9AGAM|nr:hypothetical protein SCHPADRAFT_940953 [Schizopora paradoxa]